MLPGSGEGKRRCFEGLQTVPAVHFESLGHAGVFRHHPVFTYFKLYS